MACQEAFDAHFYVRQMPLDFNSIQAIKYEYKDC